MQYDDALRAMQWGLDAQFLESKMDSSVLVCLCQAMLEARSLDDETKQLFVWALRSGAQMKMLESNSALFFQIAAFPGALWLWQRLLDKGYPLQRVVAKAPANAGVLASSKPGRVTTKLGLLCSPPYCLSTELPELITLLIDKGIDPNERDSDGYAPLGRLNEQLRQREANNFSIESYVPAIVRGVQVLLDKGADIEGVLPTPETFAAKCIQECIRAKKERSELLQLVLVPEEELKANAKRAL